MFGGPARLWSDGWASKRDGPAKERATGVAAQWLRELNPIPLTREKDMVRPCLYHDSSTPAIALRPRQAAVSLGISLSTLERLTKSGEVPVVRKGRIRLYSIEALKDWLRAKGGSQDAS